MWLLDLRLLQSSRRIHSEKTCSKLVAGGLQLKDDAKEYFETIKEDAEDAKAEKDAKNS